MGQWTADYYDDVLASKIKGLVAGSIKRSQLEKKEPTINYEAFVEGLETGDSFTTTLFDILVKELAERRTRPTDADRRLIADGTAKSLRLLATPLRIYRDRPAGRGMPNRSVNLTEYLSAPQDELDMDEDEDDFEGMLASAATATEGTRVNSNLYDAYHTPSWTSHDVPVTRRPIHSYSAAVVSGQPSDNHDSVHSPPAVSRSGPWYIPPGAAVGSNLHRQPSIRRGSRTRMVDFNEFTSRRRSSIRQSISQDSVDARSDDGNDLPEVRRSRSPLQEETSTVPHPLTTATARRFFPFSRARRQELSPSWWTDVERTEPLTDEPASVLPTEPTASGSWFSLPTPDSSSTASHEAETSDERATLPPPVPRLRRGGVRAPESMLSRHASPIEIGDNTFVIRMPPSPQSPLRFDGHEEISSNELSSPTFNAQTEAPTETSLGS